MLLMNIIGSEKKRLMNPILISNTPILWSQWNVEIHQRKTLVSQGVFDIREMGLYYIYILRL